jgi:hypothetical protein
MTHLSRPLLSSEGKGGGEHALKMVIVHTELTQVGDGAREVFEIGATGAAAIGDALRRVPDGKSSDIPAMLGIGDECERVDFPVRQSRAQESRPVNAAPHLARP